MATVSGVGGTAAFGTGNELNVRSWSLSIDGDVATGAHSSSSGWTDALAGMRSYSGSFEFYQDGSTAQPIRAGDTGSIALLDSAIEYSGTTVIANSVTYNADIEGGGLMSGTVSFTGDGALSIAYK